MTWLLALPGLLKRIPWQAYALVAFLGIGFFWHRSEVRKAVAVERQHWTDKIAADTAAQRQRESEATAALMRAQREADAAATTRKGEIDNATRNIPDQTPSQRQLARACLDLLRQGPAPAQCESFRPRQPAPARR